MDSSEGQDARVFVGNVAPDTDPSLIEQHFKVCYLLTKKNKYILEIFESQKYFIFKKPFVTEETKPARHFR